MTQRMLAGWGYIVYAPGIVGAPRAIVVVDAAPTPHGWRRSCVARLHRGTWPRPGLATDVPESELPEADMVRLPEASVLPCDCPRHDSHCHTSMGVFDSLGHLL